jgi:D-glucosaminate-specific PTS system IIB component
MSIVMTRVDARLVHGQVAARWTRTLSADQIVVIDDPTANDAFMVELLTLAGPAGAKIICYTVERAVEEWNKNQFGSKRTIIIFQNIETAKLAFDKGVKYKSLNIGQVPKSPERRHANNTVHLSDPELDTLLALGQENVEVYFHPTPDDKRVTVETVEKKMRK